MIQSKISEAQLESEGVIRTDFGEDLSWKYLSYVRAHPRFWNAGAKILYGKNDNFTSFETICGFAEKIGASLCVMENGGHWFHTQEEMRFLDEWILSEK